MPKGASTRRVSTKGLEPSSDIPATLRRPPDGVPVEPPTTTRETLLPFAQLSWENFERLCLRLAEADAAVEYCARYGRQGQAQQGIDLYVRDTSGAYSCWQAKRHKSITRSLISQSIDQFCEGTWLARTKQFVFATQASLSDTKLQEEIELQSDRLKHLGVQLVVKGPDELSADMQLQPEIVDDFFGRHWSAKVLSATQLKSLQSRLDGDAFAKARSQLHRVLHARFQVLDPDLSAGVVADNHSPFKLLDRFVDPDILQRASARPRPVRPAEDKAHLDDGEDQREAQQGLSELRTSSGDQFARIPLKEWFAEGQHLALVGEAGCGKSTLLRCIALDILGEQDRFPEICRRFGKRLPIHISFARWAKKAEQAGGQVSLSQIVEASLQPFMTVEISSLINKAIDERRILLLIDGLDEWSSEQAAATTLQLIQTVTVSLEIPAIVTGRPGGLRQIGSLAANWKRGELAPLTRMQQRQLASGWFQYYSERGVNAPSTQLARQLDRFMAELAQERGLASLAETPLLLVSLIALALRKLSLPRNRVQALQQLTELMLVAHPRSRAGAADEVHSRFQYANDAEMRREALEWLAFTIRQSGSDAGLPLNEARAVIRQYLESPETFALPAERARLAATEILAINADTQGMLVEKATGEVGFVHASFEEFLSACRLCRLDSDRLAQFVEEEAGNPRWRNVIYFALAMIKRKTEVDALIGSIEIAADGAGDDSNLRALLADIAFGSVQMSPVKARQLAKDALDLIQFGDWTPIRRKGLTAAMTALGDPVVGDDISKRIAKWAPRRIRFTDSLLVSMAGWARSPHLLDALWCGLHSEEPSTRRGSAQALAKVNGADPTIEARLSQILETSGDIGTLAGALEALILGWPSSARIEASCIEAIQSPDPIIQLIGFFGLSRLGKPMGGYRDRVIELLSARLGVDYRFHDIALELLRENWSQDSEVIARCLDSVRQRRGGGLDYDIALGVVLNSSVDNQETRDWLAHELATERFSFLGPIGGSDLISAGLARFAAQHQDIRERLIIQMIGKDFDLYLSRQGRLISALRDDRIRDHLIVIAEQAKHFNAYWALRILIDGWSVHDKIVSSLISRILERRDDVEMDIISLLPELIDDPHLCRSRLFDVATRHPNARNDLLARAFAKLGSDGADIDVVELLLHRHVGPPAFQAEAELFQHFHQHAAVRALALADLSDRADYAASIATGFRGDVEIEQSVAALLHPLSDVLRGTIVDSATSNPTDPTLARLVSQCDAEEDVELKSRLTVAWARTSAEDDRDNAIDQLTQRLRVVGHDFQSRRSAAWAGILELDGIDEMLAAQTGEHILELTMGTYGDSADTLRKLAATHWDEIVSKAVDRSGSQFQLASKEGGSLVNHLIRFMGQSSGLRTAFLDLCALPTTRLGAPGLDALRRERPQTTLLLHHYLRQLETPPVRPFEHDREEHDMYVDVPRMLRADFGLRQDLLDDFRSRLSADNRFVALMPIAFYAPEDESLASLKLSPIQLAEEYKQWPLAAALTCARGTWIEVLDFIDRAIHRSSPSGWDRQDVMNDVILERVRADQKLADALSRKLEQNPSPSEICSLPRYLSAAGLLGDDLTRVCEQLRLHARNTTALSTIGFDALAEQYRPTKLSLLDAVAPRLAI